MSLTTRLALVIAALVGVGFGGWLAVPRLLAADVAVPASNVAAAGPDSAATDPPCAGLTAPEGMVCIPAGPAVIGSDAHGLAERPRHEVTLSTFFIDTHEVTNGEYRDCVEAGGCPAREGVPRTYGPHLAANQPATPMTWPMANRYCVWAGKRLPTEAEWEKAARGATEARTYPWGDEAPSCADAHFAGCEPYQTLPVGSRPAGAYGIHDMAGNGFEWVNDWAAGCYDGCKNACGDACTGIDPQGPCHGAPWCEGFRYRVLKGGSWVLPADQLRASGRRFQRPRSGLYRLSFRCAADDPVLTRAPFWHEQRREPPPPLSSLTDVELAALHDVRHDVAVMKIKSCAKVGRASHVCRDPLSYIKSNERYRGIFGRYIENLGGGYAGVGADQAYDFISMAKSEYAWLFDYDPTVVHIHYLIRAILPHVETPRQLTDAFRVKTIERTRKWVRASLADEPEEIKPTLQTLEVYRGKLLYNYLAARKGHPRYGTFGWLGHQENFDYIRQMYAQGRIVIRKGNLLTAVVMTDIARSARRLGVPVRVYYSSNADDQWLLTEQYRDNLMALPFDRQSVVLRTMIGSRWKIASKWMYMVHSGEHMQRELARQKTDRTSFFMVDATVTKTEHLRLVGLPPIDAAGVAARDSAAPLPPG